MVKTKSGNQEKKRLVALVSVHIADRIVYAPAVDTNVIMTIMTAVSWSTRADPQNGRCPKPIHSQTCWVSGPCHSLMSRKSSTDNTNDCRPPRQSQRCAISPERTSGTRAN